MRRVFLLSGIAVWLLSCANGGNGTVNSDSSANTTNVIATDPTDTVNRGYGAGVEGEVGAGPKTGQGTGVAPTTDAGNSSGTAVGGTTGVVKGTSGTGHHADSMRK